MEHTMGNKIEFGTSDSGLVVPTVTRRGLLKGAGGAALFLAMGSPLLAACSRGGSSFAGSATAVRSTTVSWLWGTHLIAGKRGYFAEQGIDMDDVATQSGQNEPILLAGEADFLLSAPTGPIRATLAGQQIILISAFVSTYASNVVISGEAFERVGMSDDDSAEVKAAKLRGLRMATTGVGAAPDLLLRYIGVLGGLDPDRDMVLTPVQGGGPSMLAAVEAGQIDGFCLSSPTSDQGVADLGMRYVFDMSQNPIPNLVGYPYIVTGVTPALLEREPEKAVAYCEALQKAANFIQAEPDAFKADMLELFGDVDPAVFEISFNANYPIYAKSLVPTQAQFEQARDFTVLALENADAGDPDAARALKFEDVFDPSIAEQAARNVGSDY